MQELNMWWGLPLTGFTHYSFAWQRRGSPERLVKAHRQVKLFDWHILHQWWSEVRSSSQDWQSGILLIGPWYFPMPVQRARFKQDFNTWCQQDWRAWKVLMCWRSLKVFTCSKGTNRWRIALVFNGLGLDLSLSQATWRTKEIRWPCKVMTIRKCFPWSLTNPGCDKKTPYYKDTCCVARSSYRPEGTCAAPWSHLFQANCFPA